MNDEFNPAANPLASMPGSTLSGAPLTWWRTLPPGTFDLPAQQHLRAVLVAAPPLPLPGWEAAILADPAAAIGVAITVLAEGVARPDSLDRALSAVVVCAALGDPACRALLMHVLGRRSRRRADLDLLWLARAWRDSGCRETDLTLASGR